MKHLVPILDEGVTLDRGDHVIVVLDAEAWPAGLANAVDQLLDKLGAQVRDNQQRAEDNR